MIYTLKMKHSNLSGSPFCLLKLQFLSKNNIYKLLTMESLCSSLLKSFSFSDLKDASFISCCSLEVTFLPQRACASWNSARVPTRACPSKPSSEECSMEMDLLCSSRFWISLSTPLFQPTQQQQTLGGSLFHDILQCNIYFEEAGYPLLDSGCTKLGNISKCTRACRGYKNYRRTKMISWNMLLNSM